MKQLLLVFAAVMLFASCDKQASNQLATEEMNLEQVRAKLGIIVPEVVYSDGTLLDKNFVKQPVIVARNNKPKAAAVVVVVWFNDLTLTLSGTTLTTTISPNAQWAGVQKFADVTTTDGAVSVCNWYYATAPGSGATKTCETTGTGFYRSWTSDFDYNIHVSAFLSVP